MSVRKKLPSAIAYGASKAIFSGVLQVLRPFLPLDRVISICKETIFSFSAIPSKWGFYLGTKVSLDGMFLTSHDFVKSRKTTALKSVFFHRTYVISLSL
jgi:hypothetical protein